MYLIEVVAAVTWMKFILVGLSDWRCELCFCLEVQRFMECLVWICIVVVLPLMVHLLGDTSTVRLSCVIDPRMYCIEVALVL